MESINKKLKDLRVSNNLTQEQLASDLNVTRFMISYYETGREPPLNIVAQYAQRFGVSTDYLLGLSADKRLEKSELNSLFNKLSKHVQNVEIFELADITSIVDDLTKYYESGAPAGNTPIIAIRDFLHAVSPLLGALIRKDTASVLLGVNDLALASLSANNILAQYLSEQSSHE